MEEIIKYQDWLTGKERKHLPPAGIIRKTGLVCPFDHVEILDREHYHNEHDIYCPGCGMTYSSRTSQELVNEEAAKNVREYQKGVKDINNERERLNLKEADLTSRIKHAEEIGLIS